MYNFINCVAQFNFLCNVRVSLVDWRVANKLNLRAHRVEQSQKYSCTNISRMNVLKGEHKQPMCFYSWIRVITVDASYGSKWYAFVSICLSKVHISYFDWFLVEHVWILLHRRETILWKDLRSVQYVKYIVYSPL